LEQRGNGLLKEENDRQLKGKGADRLRVLSHNICEIHTYPVKAINFESPVWRFSHRLNNQRFTT